MPSIRPFTFKSSRKLVPSTGWRVWPCPAATSFKSAESNGIYFANRPICGPTTSPLAPVVSKTPFKVTVIYWALLTLVRLTWALIGSQAQAGIRSDNDGPLTVPVPLVGSWPVTVAPRRRGNFVRRSGFSGSSALIERLSLLHFK